MPLDELRKTVHRYHFEDRYQRIKLKIEPGFDIEPVQVSSKDSAALVRRIGGAKGRVERLELGGAADLERPEVTALLAAAVAEVARHRQVPLVRPDRGRPVAARPRSCRAPSCGRCRGQ